MGVIRSGTDGPGYRVALPDGSLGSGSGTDRAPKDTVRDDTRLDAVRDSAEDGLWVIAPTPQSLQEAPDMTWVSAQQRADRRTATASNGCLVAAAA